MTMDIAKFPDMERANAEFIRISQRLFALGIQTSTGGNLSLLVDDGQSIVVKPSGISLYDCTATDLLVIQKDGKLIKGTRRPTKEINFHLGIYRVRPDVGGVVHTHAPWATSFACARQDLPLITVHSKRILKKIQILPDYPDGSLELADEVTKAFSNLEVKAVLLADHGVVGVGKTLTEAENIVELLEETAKTALGMKLLQL
jgi:L-ribulose-5-phosphate 4-epimerase